MRLPACDPTADWNPESAWAAIRQLQAQRAVPEAAAAAFDLTPHAVQLIAAATPLHPERIRVFADGRWRSTAALPAAVAQMFDLYLPLACTAPGRRFIIAHLGQSLDGRIAPLAGCSAGLTGPENYDHMHRLRALVDAVIVGAGTVRADDPRLTVRRVPGSHPVRVVIDTEGRLDGGFRMVTDGVAPVVYCRAHDAAPHAHLPAHVQQLVIRRGANGLDLTALIAALAERGWSRLLVEGGGITVSRFLAQGCLDRLQITVAPVLLGAGRLGIDLAEGLGEARRRPAFRRYLQGRDVLFDLDVSSPCP